MDHGTSLKQSMKLPSSDASQSTAYNPRILASADELAIIIASHEKLQQWNDATETALNSDGGLSDTNLIQNIRSMAALVASSNRNVTSQNFELMRAMNISDRTLSGSELALSFIDGATYDATAPAREMVDMQQPCDMRIDHATKRAELLENSIMHIGSQTLDVFPAAVHALHSAWEHPEKVSNALARKINDSLASYQHRINEVPKIIASGLTTPNPEQAIGFSLGVATIGMIREVATASGRKMRDFSAQMEFKSMGNGNVSQVTYQPDAEHYVIGHVISGTLHYKIQKSDGERWGHGSEMAASMLEKFKQNGVEIERIQGAMAFEGPESSIGRQYLDAIAAGHTPEEAAFRTLTGQQAKTLGMDTVIVPPINPITNSIQPLFIKKPYARPSDDQHSSLDQETAKDMIVGHLKTLGLPPEKEQITIAQVEKNFDAESHENSFSA